MARAQVPETVAHGIAMARLTALSKPDGGVRGIATGDVFRRLVSRTLAKQWAGVFDQATQPYQFALQARAGTDALAAHVRTALSLRRDAVVVSLAGRSAYDSISRASFLTKLREVAPALLPFVRLFYGQASAYLWWDADGNCRDVRQGEGCEQGDPLAPALYALGQHDALQRAAEGLDPSASLLAFLDALYVVTPGPATDAGPGDWPHGWQFHASRIRNIFYRDRVMLPAMSPDRRALLRSQAGVQAGAWLAAIPSALGTGKHPLSAAHADCPSSQAPPATRNLFQSLRGDDAGLRRGERCAR